MPCPNLVMPFFVLGTSIVFTVVFSGIPTSTSPLCPQNCICGFHNKVLVTADCSNKHLQAIPRDLPNTLKSLNLSVNLIARISANELKNVPYLQILDLQSNCLKYLPSDVFAHLSSLQSLNISNNTIKSLDAYSFRNLTSLKNLNLNSNLLFSHPETFPNSVFQDLINLSELDLQKNFGKCPPSELSYPHEALASLYNLEKLHIDGFPDCGALGVGFRNLSRLRLLDFGNSIHHVCQTTKLPSNFFSNIRTSETLEVSFLNCNLQFIHPHAFAGIPSLSRLTLTGNHYLNFTGFLDASTSFYLLRRLQKIDISAIKKPFAYTLSSAYLIHLKNTSLETIIMRGNCFTNILADVPSRLPNSLKTWDISDNCLVKVDFRFSLILLVNLRVLNASVQIVKRNDVALESLWHSSANLEHVESELSTNIQSFSFPSQRLTLGSKNVTSKIKNIDLVENSSVGFDQMTAGQWLHNVWHVCQTYSPNIPLSMFNKTIVLSRPEWMKNRWHIKYQNIRNLYIQERTVAMPDVSYSLPQNLSRLLARDINIGISLGAVTITCNKVLDHVDVSFNYIWCFKGPIKGISTVSVFDLSNNYAIALDPMFFAYMDQLKKLTLRFNSIGFSLELDSDGKTFSSLSQLEYLDLTYTDTHELSPKAFINNTRLKTILLNNNALYCFAPQISQLTQLEYLDLSYNDLPRLSDQTMEDLNEIKKTSNVKINLQKNPLRCDCDSWNFLRWFYKTNVTFAQCHFYHCKFINGTHIRMDQVVESLDILWRICSGRSALLISTISFSVMAIVWTVAALFSIYRDKIFFYVYVSKQRFFFHNSNDEQRRIQDVFLVFDDQDLRWRRHVLDVLLPNLSRGGISYHVSELGVYQPSAGRNIREVVQEAILCGRKTVVLLTEDIFLDEERQLAVTMAKIIQDMSGSKILLFLAAEKLRVDNLPVHLHRLLRSDRIMNYTPASGPFWAKLIDEIKK